ncbi:hypothetical protein OS493_011254 [Desmophyllum pertusum]|uniref:Uncharacterized protein n=1 Tax=Desmophyllum pertusum TaxID=174260 RepID=A0A9W9Z2A5_9CNID|nr:hypothetical protein OS493_011254 [Desmophyllum pertusum]
MCLSCIPNTTVVPPVFCDNPVDYAMVNCSENVPCFTTRVMSSINQPVYVLGCGDTTCSAALNMTVCLAAKSIDPGLKSCETSCCNHTTNCNTPTIVTTPAPTSVPRELWTISSLKVDEVEWNIQTKKQPIRKAHSFIIHETTCSAALNMTVCLTAKSIDPGLKSCETTCCNHTTNCNTPTIVNTTSPHKRAKR